MGGAYIIMVLERYLVEVIQSYVFTSFSENLDETPH